MAALSIWDCISIAAFGCAFESMHVDLNAAFWLFELFHDLRKIHIYAATLAFLKLLLIWPKQKQLLSWTL